MFIVSYQPTTNSKLRQAIAFTETDAERMLLDRFERDFCEDGDPELDFERTQDWIQGDQGGVFGYEPIKGGAFSD